MRIARLCGVLKAAMFLAGLALLFAADPATAQPVEVPSTWGGDFFSRPRLTGDWGGLRDDLGKKGVVLDLDLLLTPQDVATGGRSTGADLWGNMDYTLNLDTGKLGLWPGGFLKIHGDTGFGSNVFNASGGIVPVNTAGLIPAPDDRTSALMGARFTQFLSPHFAVSAGKIDLFDFSEQEFYGDYRTQFMNAGLNFPMTLELVPLSAYGGGIIVVPTDDVVASAFVLDANGTPTNDSLGDAFSNGETVFGGGQWTIKPFGLVGHQNLSFSWSNKDRFSLTQDPTNIANLLLQERFPRLQNPGPALTAILARFFPALLTPTEPANRSSSTWSISYGFDQYFWQPDGDPKHGIGLFFSFGASDGNPNPLEYSFLTGIGGKGVVPGRPDDSFGLGFSRTEFSGDFVPFLRQNLNLGLQHEDAFETYYNAALTQWLSATADLQVISPGINKQLSSSGLGLTNVDTSVVVGVRVLARF